jgi:glycosyltransferase involved in cell wall biosynthesis
MPERLKVLMSAYACEPNRGSEPEVGWQWARQMARFHDVTVLTRANNRPAIEKVLPESRDLDARLRFIYFDLSESALRLKRWWRNPRLYYHFWQQGARRLIRASQPHERYQLFHHVTFASYRYPTALWGHGVPMIWGPVGGAETIPMSLLPWRHWGELGSEGTRNIATALSLSRWGKLRRRARASDRVLASTRAMQKSLADLGEHSDLMPAIGLDTAAAPVRSISSISGPLKFLFVGNLQALKGLDLALEALQQSRTGAQLTLIGDGPFQNALVHMTARLGLATQVSFLGRRPREEVMAAYANYHALLFPSLHDTGGYAVIEAMLKQLPVICLDCGGPAMAVTEDCGLKVSLGTRAEVIAGLAAAIQRYHHQRELLITHGNQARRRIETHYDWDRKGEQMNEVYWETLREFSAGSA